MKSAILVLLITFTLAIRSQSINQFYENGLTKLENKDYQGAITEFDKVTSKDPYYFEAFYARAQAYMGLENYAKALEDCSGAIKAKKDYFEAYILRSDVNLKLNKKKDALSDLEKIVEMKPDYTAAWEKMGALYFSENNKAKAREVLDKAISLKAKSATTYYFSAELFFEKEEYAKAKDHFSKSAGLDPKSRESFKKLGICGLKTEDWAGAEKAFTAAINLGDDQEAVSGRAEARFNLKKYQESADDYAAFIYKTKTRDPEIYHKKGLALSNMGKHDLAVKEFAKAIMYDRNFFKSYYERAVSYSAMGSSKESLAMKDFSKALEINPDCGEAYYKRGKYYFDKQKFAEAESDFSKALKYLQDAEIYYLRGAANHELGETKKACEDLKKAADLGHKKAAEDKLRICR